MQSSPRTQRAIIKEKTSLISVLPAKHFPGAQHQPLEYPGLRPSYSYVYYQNHVYEIVFNGISLNDCSVTTHSGRVPLDVFLGKRGNALLAERHAVLAVGSNGCPGRLAEKFVDVPKAAIPVFVGKICDVAAVYSRRIASYGAFPATVIRQSGIVSSLSVPLLTQEQLALMDKSENVGKKYERISISSDFVAENGATLEKVTAYFDSNILSYHGRPIYLKTFASDQGQGVAMDEREVLSLVFDQAGLMRGESIEWRHQQLLENDWLPQELTQFVESNMADLQCQADGAVLNSET